MNGPKIVAPAWVANQVRAGLVSQRPTAAPMPFQPLQPRMAPIVRDRVLTMALPGRDPVVVSRLGRMVLSAGEADAARIELQKQHPGAKLQVLSGVQAGDRGTIVMDGRPVIVEPRAVAWP